MSLSWLFDGQMAIWIVDSLLLFLPLLYYWWWSAKKLPPGPIGLPLFGYRIRHHEYLKHFGQLKDKFGPVFSYYAGRRLVVVLNNYESVNDTIIRQGDKFVNRIHSTVRDKFSHGFGLLFANGKLWKEQRRFALSTLRDFGFGRPIIENCIMEEVEALVKELHLTARKPYDVQLLMNKVVSNVICKIAFGKRFDYDDIQFETNLKTIIGAVGSDTSAITKALEFQDWMFYWPPVKRILLKTFQFFDGVTQFLQVIINEHKDNFDATNEPTDYIYAFLKQQAQHGGDYFLDEQLLKAIIDLFVAGTETTSTTIRWAILLLAKNPEVQEKIHKSIADMVGLTSLPRLADRPKLPYLEAAILEIQRVGNLVPIPTREAIDLVHLNQYEIPTGAAVIFNTYEVHNDPQYFPDPSEFRPERFLTADGKLTKIDAFMPFGAGKRICIGESLAKMELFLFMAGLFQQFRFEFPLDHKLTGFVVAGITRQPEAFKIVAVPRILA